MNNEHRMILKCEVENSGYTAITSKKHTLADVQQMSVSGDAVIEGLVFLKSKVDCYMSVNCDRWKCIFDV